MGAREELAAIRERVEHQPCCDHSGADEHGCWDCQWTGCAHAPYVDGAAAEDMTRLVKALEGVLAIPEQNWDAYDRALADVRDAIEAALTTDTKGEPR